MKKEVIYKVFFDNNRLISQLEWANFSLIGKNKNILLLFKNQIIRFKDYNNNHFLGIVLEDSSQKDNTTIICPIVLESRNIDTVYAEEVFTEILSGGEYSLLNEIIKNKNNTAIYVTDIGLFNHYNGLFGAMAVVPKGNGEKFKNEAMAIIEDIG